MPVAAFHRHDERKPELGLVGIVEFGEAGEFLGGARVDARAGLLRGGGGGQLAADGCLAGQVRVSVDQRQLLVAAGTEQDVGHALLQAVDVVDVGVQATLVGAFGDPRRVLVDVGEGGDEGVAAQLGRGEGLEAAHFALSALKGWVACQWRAMSSRRAIQTFS
ncbi:hypothetical protein D9M70_552900 [compost metagenome]